MPADLSTPKTFRLAICDLNAQARGKRMPSAQMDKVVSAGARMPLSAFGVDIWGEDIADSPLVFETGDADGLLRPTERGAVPMPWFNSTLVPCWGFLEDGAPYEGDPRRALQNVLDRYRARGWTPVAATEMEFHLVDADATTPVPHGSEFREVLSLDGLDAFDGFFTDLYNACEQMNIPADAAISEGGRGQFEINLLHGDAMQAADNAWLFKQAVHGIARQHGHAATFMAKPFADDAGNGMHVHFSVLDRDGVNIFDDGGDQGSDTLRYGVGGLLNAMAASTLIFAPHKNSYRRMESESHAPTAICWGYENRTVAIRIPGGPPVARRIEHRVAGGDVNPYLLLAAVLGAALNGIENAVEPPEPTSGNAYEADREHLPDRWEKAIDAFSQSDEMKEIFHPELVRALVACKRQEFRRFEQQWTNLEIASYLTTV